VSYTLLGKEVRGRFGFPSGVIATNDDTARWMIEHIPQLGFFTGKSTTIEPREGYDEDILSQPSPDALWNAVGYANPGLEKMVESFRALRESTPPDVFLLPQIGESSEESFAHCVAAFDSAGVADGIEINISCPHVARGGILIGSDPDSVSAIVSAARDATTLPLVVKLNAGVQRLEEVALAAVEAGADALSAINTLGGPNPELTNGFGGLSGPPLFPVTVATIRRLRNLTAVPIMVMGGIRGAADIRTLDAIDPTFFYAIGSSLGGLDSVQIQEYFQRLETDLAGETDSAAELTLDRMLMEYRPFTVAGVTWYGPDLCRLRFREDLEATTGQFVFLKVGTGMAKPFSVASCGDGLELLIRRVGPMTQKACELTPNAVVRIRGPYGQPFAFAPEREVIFVGAGCGIAPIHHAARLHPGPKRIIIGTTKAEELAYLEELQTLGEVAVSTDDGSAGFRGFVSQLLEKNLAESPPSGALFYTCGPEVAMREVDRIARQYAAPEEIHHLVERMTSCGIGICGKCSTPGGERSCVDGPIHTADRFTPGEYTRDKAGAKIAEVTAGPGSSCDL